MKALFATLLFVSFAFSQVIVSVDESISKNKDKNLFFAIGSSAFLPGMGEMYLGESNMVKPFLWTDLALWVTTFSSYVIGERYINSAHNYAVRYAGLNTSSKNSSLLNTVGDFRSRSGVMGQNSSPDMNEDYNQAQLRSGKKIDEEWDESIEWDWGSSDNPETSDHIDEFKSRMRHYRVSRIVFQASVGALVLNRLISVLDVIRVYRKTSSKSFSNKIEFLPEFYEDGSGINVNVKF